MTMGRITHAYVTYKDSKKKCYTVPISDVKCKKNSETHLKPKNETDFEKNKLYYVKWSDCHDGEKCKMEHEHSGYYAAFIHYLGESLQQVQEKVAEGRRIIIPRGIQSSESEENIKPSQRLKHNTAAQDVQRKKNVEILNKLKSQTSVSSRKRLIDNSDDEVNEEINDNSNGEEYETELSKKDKEIDNLRKMILELQQRQDRSQPATLASDNSKGKGGLTVRRNLFREDDVETDVHPQQEQTNKVDSEIRIDEYTKGCSASTSLHRAVKPSITQIETVNIDVNKVLKKDNYTRTKDSTGKNYTGISAEDIMESGPSVERSPTNVPDMSHRKRRLQTINSPSQNDPESSDDEEHSDNENELIVGAKQRLPLQEKRRRPGNIPDGVKRKSHREINEALKHYENDEADQNGRKRYEIVGDKIYLGEGIEVSISTWFFIREKSPHIFFHDLIGMLWPIDVLVNRCQNKSKVMTTLEDRSPMKELTPEKKRLSFKLYADYLDYRKIKKEQKFQFLAKVSYLYTTKINYLRGKYYQ